MRYQELRDEYTELLLSCSGLLRQIQTMPKGCITTKRISGKEYHYLQYTVCGKKKSEYIRESELSLVRENLILRETLCTKIEQQQENLDRLERAVKILDEELSQTFFYLRQCANMDALPLSKRSKALSFARAMTALEGLPAQNTTEENLQSWARGEKSFADFYLPSLRSYGIMEVSE